MKKISIVCLTALMSCAAALVNCEAALAQEKEMRYENALNFRMINKGVPDGVTSNPYQRYPDALKEQLGDYAERLTGVLGAAAAENPHISYVIIDKTGGTC